MIPAVVGAAAAGGAAALGLAGSGLDYLGGLKANKSRQDAANEANAWNVYLTTHAHRIEVNDLKKAGLNPILSAGGSGASGPNLQIPDIENPFDDAGGKMGKIMTSAAEVRKMFQEVDNLRKDKELKDANIKNINEDTERIREVKRSQFIANQRELLDFKWDIEHGKSYGAKKYGDAYGGWIKDILGLGAVSVAGAKVLNGLSTGARSLENIGSRLGQGVLSPRGKDVPLNIDIGRKR